MTVREQARLIDAAAFLRLLGTAPIGGTEDQTIAGFEWSDLVSFGRFHDRVVRLNGHNARDMDTAMARGAARDYRLVIGACGEEGPETP